MGQQCRPHTSAGEAPTPTALQQQSVGPDGWLARMAAMASSQRPAFSAMPLRDQRLKEIAHSSISSIAPNYEPIKISSKPFSSRLTRSTLDAVGITGYSPAAPAIGAPQSATRAGFARTGMSDSKLSPHWPA
jgi:hypothetical protein